MTKTLSPSIGVRRRHRSDPKPAHPSSPIAKRQRLLPPSVGVTPVAAAPAAPPTGIRLPIDAVSASFLYLDVGDVSSVSAACRDWNAAMKTVEQELWLGLVRRHCPAVEEVTGLLELSQSQSPATSPEGRGPGTNFGVGIGGGSIAPPAPSLSWRGQFQRRVLLAEKSDDAAAAARARAERPPPKPLGSYLFQVDLVLYQAGEGDGAGKGAQVGIVTRVFSDCAFNDDRSGRIRLKMDRLGEEMAQYNDAFATFDVRITIYDKATGRQAVVHNRGMEDWWDSNVWFFGFGRIADAYKLDNFGTSDAISTMLTVEKIGCVSGCQDDDSWDFFTKPFGQNCCCKCGTKWSCFWDMVLEMHIVADFEWDIIDLINEQQLRVMEELLDFK